MSTERRLPIGAEPTGSGTHFRVWAPLHRTVAVVLESGSHTLTPEPGGYFAGQVSDARVGDRYRYLLDGTGPFPDPVSRFQPEGPHGPSQIVDPNHFEWADGDWKGLPLRGQIIYEMHVGTFTREGTWDAAARELPELARVGITVIEVMPVADFPGRFGWGYDGVNLFAPTRLYGTPDDFRRFINRAHACGLAVILDVVYNHFGPDGNYLSQFAAEYVTDRHENEWGPSIDFDGPGAAPVREYFIANAGYWVDEFHIDGLRIDASQAIHDDTNPHVLVEIERRVRATARGRETIIITENEPQEMQMIRPASAGGFGLDGLYNDDFHHSAMVALTGRNEAYYSDHHGSAQEFISAAKYGCLFQGQRYAWQQQRRGTPGFDLPPWKFVNFLQNHDQIANSAAGVRCAALTSPARQRAMTAVFLLFPGTPLLFMGQEFGASAPFHYFADHEPKLAALVHTGRVGFMKQFRSLDRPELKDWFPVPSEEDTFARCKLDFRERETNAPIYRMHEDLMRLRRTDPAFQPHDTRSVDGAVLGDQAFVLRYFTDGLGDRLLIVNLGRELHHNQLPEPLLAPPLGCRWEMIWSSEAREYGGTGTPPCETEDGWRLLGETALVLAAKPFEPHDEVAGTPSAKDRAEECLLRERTPMS